MEGYWNPFKDFYKSKSFGNINTENESYNLGKSHGKILRELGFNVNFSPVVEIRNNVWPGRNFEGDLNQIKKKISKYIEGIEEQEIMATAKHFPGGNLVKDPHLFKYTTKIYPEDLDLFKTAVNSGVDFVMVGHPKTKGEIDSEGKQATISKNVISKLKKDLGFKGLVITDAVTMMGLRLNLKYIFNFKRVYSDLINAGNDVILDTSNFSSFRKIKKRIRFLEKCVNNNKISQKKINESVKKILKMKGYSVRD